MRQIGLNTELVRSKLLETGESVASLGDRLGVDRSTVHRWIDAGRLPSGERTLELSAALDIDPITLMDISPSEFGSILPDLTRVAREGSWRRHLPAFDFVEHYLFPNDQWPPANIPSRYGRRGREWVLKDITHDPSDSRHDYYASLIIRPVGPRFVMPQAWHFAYRESSPGRDRPWFPYGVVIRFDGDVRLLNYIGEAEMADAPMDVTAINVQTYFGRHKLEFRIASLHPFECSVAEDPPPDLPRVGFRYPGPP